MQGITIAIGKTGIQFFTQNYLVGTLVTLLGKLAPPNRTIQVANFKTYPSYQVEIDYSAISIVLSNGSLIGFSPTFKTVTQGVADDSAKTPIFTLTFAAGNFSAKYDWQENYHWDEYDTYTGPNGPVVQHTDGNTSTPLSYSPGFGQLTAMVIVQFLFDSSNNAWEITTYKTSAQTANLTANIPGSSILNGQDASCAGTHVDDATAQAISAIDFATPLNSLLSGIIKTIPGSGNLGDGMVYDFSLGDSGLVFPNNDGIQMGVKGGASYNGTAFSGPTPPSLPLPVPPTDSDTHHLSMYVSNYEVDALNWAYYKAGKLNLLITPQDLPDPKLLLVSSYTTFEPSLTPYSAFVMNAQLTQNIAPVTSFQTAYVYSKSAMTLLQQQLPATVYTLIEALPSNAYLSQTSLEAFLTQATVPNQYFTTIENAGKTSAMVLTQDISYTLTIQNNANPQPNITFSVKRVDVLTNLGLGISLNNTQTLQFASPMQVVRLLTKAVRFQALTVKFLRQSSG
ncbi:hypothetical protein [Methylocucumis oryzae]|uniref:Uncharacterized protein n=1 Tax=Methylocucumis oryzae TaxID=1632867 RepID=A0A0F3IIE3_9GAMM|nr:hypothetical protein [Methylocucumis oryzae]KJV06545.1 hypothetical protein VZ94_10425 [Methylocucumis oryzae]